MTTESKKQSNQQQEPDKVWNMMFISIFFANMVMNLSMQMSNSLLSVYANSLGAKATAIGMLMSMFAVTALLFKIVSAPAMDTYNRKYLIIGSMIILSIAFFGFSISKSVPMLAAFRLLQGCGQAFGNVCCLAMVAEALPKEKYGTGMGYYSLAQVISQAIGPTVGLWLVGLVGYKITYVITACIMIFAAILACQIKYKFKRTKKLKIILNNIIAKEAILPAAVMFFISMAFSSVGSFLIIFAQKQGVTSNIGLYFTVSAATMLLTRPTVGKLTDKYGLVKVFVPALFCDVIAFFIISDSHTLMMFLLAAFISAFGFGACQPAIQTLAMKCVTKDRRGAGSSTNFVGMDLGTLAGPVLAGFTTQAFGYIIMWRIMVIPLFIDILVVFMFRGEISRIEENFIINGQDYQ